MPEHERAAVTVSGERLALSAAQLGIWIGQQLDRNNPAYWTAEAVELQGELDANRFAQAVQNTVNECEALQMHFHCEGEQVWQEPARTTQTIWQILDFTAASADAWQAAQKWMQIQLQQPADLEQGPLFSSALLRIGPQRHQWFLRAHHIVLDGFAFALVARRVAAWYSALIGGDTAAGILKPARAPAAFAPVIAEDQTYQNSPEFHRDGEFWRQRLQDAPAPPRLATLQPVGYAVVRVRNHLPAGSMQRCQQVATGAGVDWPSWMLATIIAWLHAATGRTDITLGLPIMGRMGSAALNVPCMHMNIVPLRIHVNLNDSIAELARKIAAEMKAIRPHQRYRYEQLRRDLGLLNSDRRLFGPVINIMPFDRPRTFAHLASVTHPISAGPVEDLAISITPQGDQVRLDFEGNGLAWTDTHLQQRCNEWQALLERALQQPAQPCAQLLLSVEIAWNASLLRGAPLIPPPQPVTQRFLQQALASPDRVALEQEGSPPLTYAQLLHAVQCLADQLRGHGIGTHSRVALLLPRTPDTIAAMLAVLWTGAAYVPLDPAGPPERQQHVLTHAQPHLLLTRPAGLDRIAPEIRRQCIVWAQENFIDGSVSHQSCVQQNIPALREPVTAGDGHPAYIIYTSGSTGTPNGVVISQAALAHFIAASATRYHMQQDDRVLQFAPLHFDACVEEIFLPLCTGARLVLRTDTMLDSIPHFLQACAQQRISVLDLPTAFWHELVYCMDTTAHLLPDTLRLVIIGGEAALPQPVQRWRARVNPSVTLLNTYGPTETTVVCATAVLAGAHCVYYGDESIPVGAPLPGLDLIIVDEHLQPVPQGDAGELCVLGPTLALNYFGNPELTATRFTKLDCLPESPRAYRTGDRMRLVANGQLLYLGRLDDELKLSGQRVSPAEIESALSRCPGISDGVALVVDSVTGAKQIVACVIPAADTAPDIAQLRRWLAQYLLPAAVPRHFLFVTQFPKNANGKIDRRQLRERWHSQQASTDPTLITGAESELERTIIHVWRDILGSVQIDRHSDFFALGGKSLQAIQVINRLSRQLQRELAVSALFRHPSVSALAHYLENTATSICEPSAPRTQDLAPLIQLQSGQGNALFCVHPADGVSWCYLGLLRHLPTIPIYGLQAEGLTGALPADFDTMIERYCERIFAQQAQGPYQLLGWSSGGGIAHAIAARLQQEGHTVALLATMDAYPAGCWADAPAPTRRDAIRMLLDDSKNAFDADGNVLGETQLLAQVLASDHALAALGETQINRMIDTTLHGMQLYRRARHPHFNGDLLFFNAARRLPGQPEWTAWRDFIGGHIQVVNIDSDHFAMHLPRAAAQIGAVLAAKVSS
ncbi:MAG: amino acid adenylation domain-containing protein [Pseudomonadota bacterium]